MTAVRRLCLLGATGSIGRSTLDVVTRHPERYRVHALSAQQRMEDLAQLASEHAARLVVVPDAAARARFIAAWPGGTLPEILLGAEGLVEAAAHPDSDTVMAAIVGTAGLASALAAARAGKRILLANKESLVAAGRIFMRTVAEHGAELLPIDSEHNAIFQCLPEARRQQAAGAGRGSDAIALPGIRRLILTASGGPFRTRELATLREVTPAQACAHPNWSMGRKISVDSATMFNKGLEVIEAHWLFGVPPAQLDVLIHPQSVVHSMVEYDDGSVLAQLGQPDMRTPIAYGLAYPERIQAGVTPLDFTKLASLVFEAPDLARFPCLDLALQALRHGQNACIALNAANEVAVAAFLDGALGYTEIAPVIAGVLDWQQGQSLSEPETLDAVLALDAAARRAAHARLPSGI